MELTKFGIARPEERIWSSDFESRIDWYKNYLAGKLERGNFIQLFFVRNDCYGLRVESELVPPDDIINHCILIKDHWLKTGYFRWLFTLEKQLAKTGVILEIPESLAEPYQKYL